MDADSLINTSAYLTSPHPPPHHASSSSLHPFPLSRHTSMRIATHINMKKESIYKHTVSSFSCFLPFLSFISSTHPAPLTGPYHYTYTLKDVQTHAHTQYPVLEMHGGRLLRRGKPSVNDSSCGKIMFLMQRRLMEGDDFLNG